MSKYKLVAVDLDGTLLDESYTVTPEIKDMVCRAQARGIGFTFATGRLFPSARQFAAELGLTLPLVTYNGALVKEAAGKQPLFHLPLAKETAREVLDLTREWPGRRFVFIDDVVYTDTDDEVTRHYAKALRVKFRRLTQLEEALIVGPTMITFRDDPPEIDKLTGCIRKHFQDKIYLVNSRPFFLDIAHREVSKGRGLAELCGQQGIKPEEVIAVGDGWNDLEMLEFAGLGAVVANAPEGLKAGADYVAAGSHYHGVIEIMEKFLGI
ncbi:MAG: Cof-type HAD-IIB family hydrolase [Bacillota bacterium]